MGKNEDSFFLNYLPIRITLVSLEKAELPPFLGSALRGVIGQALFQDKNAYNYLYHNFNPRSRKGFDSKNIQKTISFLKTIYTHIIISRLTITTF